MTVYHWTLEPVLFFQKQTDKQTQTRMSRRSQKCQVHGRNFAFRRAEICAMCREVEKLAGLEDIRLRGGCFCNPGACSASLGLSDQDIQAICPLSCPSCIDQQYRVYESSRSAQYRPMKHYLAAGSPKLVCGVSKNWRSCHLKP